MVWDIYIAHGIVFVIVKARVGSHKTVHIIKLRLEKRLINISLLIHKFCQ